jgi:GNAT superfamily N-acetyltransferase
VGVERAEAAFWAAFLRNRNLDATTVDDGAVALAGGYALCSTGGFLQYAIGVGSTRPLRPDDLEIAEAFYAARGLPSRLELTGDVLERDGALLAARGYIDEGTALAVLEAELPLADETTGAVTTRIVTGRRVWVALALRAFADTVEPADADRLQRSVLANAAAANALFVAAVGGVDAGAAAVALADDLALLYSGAVLPEYRGARVHGALLAARVAYACSRGATRATFKTLVDSAAERSAARRGFTRTALRRRVARPA